MSRLEQQLALQLQAAGLRFSREVGGLVPGRRYRVDFLVEDRVVVECEGGLFRDRRSGRRGPGHTSTKQILRDLEKANELQLAGWPVMRVAAPHIRLGQALAWIEKALARGVSAS